VRGATGLPGSTGAVIFERAGSEWHMNTSTMPPNYVLRSALPGAADGAVLP